MPVPPIERRKERKKERKKAKDENSLRELRLLNTDCIRLFDRERVKKRKMVGQFRHCTGRKRLILLQLFDDSPGDSDDVNGRCPSSGILLNETGHQLTELQRSTRNPIILAACDTICALVEFICLSTTQTSIHHACYSQRLSHTTKRSSRNGFHSIRTALE